MDIKVSQLGLYMGINGRNLKNILFLGFHSPLVPCIPYSAIAKTILNKHLFFTYFVLWRVTLKSNARLKQIVALF